MTTLQEDVSYVHSALDSIAYTKNITNKMKLMVEMFLYLIEHPRLLKERKFRVRAIPKIREIRSEIDLACLKSSLKASRYGKSEDPDFIETVDTLKNVIVMLERVIHETQ